MKILLIEDDVSVRNVLKIGLESLNFIVDDFQDGEAGLYAAKLNKYDLIILDYVLPKKTGKEVCAEIRDVGINTPIIILSSRNSAHDKIELLNCGADDYMTKPFSFEELKARIRCVHRRPLKIEGSILKYPNITLNKDRNEILIKDKKIYFTKKEFLMLQVFMENIGKVVSRSLIIEKVWDMNANPLSNTIEAHILGVRKKIGDKKKEVIKNVPGIGYKMVDPQFR